MNYPNWEGVLLGEVSKIDRRSGETYLSPRATAQWVSVQVGLVRAAKLDPEEKARFAGPRAELWSFDRGSSDLKVKGILDQYF
jgi:hypothetical protein